MREQIMVTAPPRKTVVAQAPARETPVKGLKLQASGREFKASAYRSSKTVDKPSGLPSWFKERDKDSDGQVGIYEWPGDDLKEFGRYDRNRDGFVTAEEVIFITQPRVVAKASTESKPTEIKKPEETPTPPPTTTASTAPKSGSSSEKESAENNWSGGFFSVLNSATTSSRTASTSSSSNNTSGPNEGIQRLFKSMDKNGDGKLVKDEWFERFPVSFSDADGNSDGQVDLKEMAEGMEKSRSRSRGGERRGRGGFGFQ